VNSGGGGRHAAHFNQVNPDELFNAFFGGGGMGQGVHFQFGGGGGGQGFRMHGMQGGGFGGLFGDMHRGGGGQQVRRKPEARNQSLFLTLEELYNGTQTTISINKTKYVNGPLGLMQQESRSNVALEVKRGWKIGTTATVKGGEAESDVILTVKPKKHRSFTIDGTDLYYETYMSISAVFGVFFPRVKLRAINGQLVSVDVAEDIRAGTLLQRIYPGVETVVKGKGMPLSGGEEFGDLIVRCALFPPYVFKLVGGYMFTGLKYFLMLSLLFSFINGGNVLGLLWILFMARSLFGQLGF